MYIPREILMEFPDIQGENNRKAFLDAVEGIPPVKETPDVKGTLGVKGVPSILRYAPPTLTGDEAFMLEAVALNELAYRYASPKLQADEGFYRRALAVNYMVFVHRAMLGKESMAHTELTQYVQDNPVVMAVGRQSPQSPSSPLSSMFFLAAAAEEENEPVPFTAMSSLSLGTS